MPGNIFNEGMRPFEAREWMRYSRRRFRICPAQQRISSLRARGRSVARRANAGESRRIFHIVEGLPVMERREFPILRTESDPISRRMLLKRATALAIGGSGNGGDPRRVREQWQRANGHYRRCCHARDE